MFLYRAFGLTLASEIHCPELLPGAGAPDVDIRIGATADGNVPSSGFDAAPGHFELRVPRVGLFIVSGGRTITITPDPRADEDTIRLFLFGTAMGALLHQRGFLPLHGSAVCREGLSLLIVGASGAGKSSLSSALSTHGWSMQSDDICAVRLTGSVAWCEAAFPRRKMWPDVLKQLGEDPRAHAPVRPGLEKRNQIVGAARFRDAAAPVCGIVVLAPSRAPVPAITPVHGPIGMTLLKRQTFRANLRGPLDMHLPQFAITARLVQQARMWRLQRPRAGGSPLALAEVLLPELDAAWRTRAS